MRICPILCVLIAGCSSTTGIEGCTPEGCADAGADAAGDLPDFDAGPILGPGADGGGVDASGGLFGEDFTSTDSRACGNGVDDDGDTVLDCVDTGCSQSPFCCLGQASASCCAPEQTLLSIDFATCATLDACDGATTFGSATPILLDGALVPNGDYSDSGVVLGAPLDARAQRITLRATIAAPAEPCADCLDAVALGVSDAQDGDMAWVLPDAAVVVRASRGDYALVIAGEVVASRALTDDLAHEYTLALSPDGSVVLTAPGETIVSTWSPRPARSVVLYGRTRNRPASAPPPARAEKVSISLGECEMPSAIAREGTRLLPPDETWGSVAPSAPSALVDGTSVLLAFSAAGDIHLARSEGAGFALVSGDTDVPTIDAQADETLTDPELVREGDHFVLYVTRTRDGMTRIARAVGGADFSMTFGALEDLSLPSGATSLSDPSVVTWGGGLRMAAVAELAGTTQIVLLTLSGTSLGWIGDDPNRSIVARARGGLFPFDAEEVDGPALFVDGANLLRVYYAGRRGSRWSVGVTISADGENWLYAPEDPVLAGSGFDFDALSVRDPSVVRVDDALHLYYTASDGTQTSIGRASGATRW